MLYKKQLQQQRIKSAIVIAFLLCFALVATYFIYDTFKDARDAKVNSPNLEVTFHEATKDSITLLKFHPVSDSIGLSSQAYTFTVKNQRNHQVSYKIELVDDLEEQERCGCQDNLIPKELLKLSVRKDHQVADAVLLSEYQDHILRADSLDANQEENYTIRIWAVNSNFVVNSSAHYHGRIKVTEI